MDLQPRPACLLAKACAVLLAALATCVLSAVAAGVAAATAVSASPTPAAKPFVNWGWLAAGLGGAAVLLVVMYLLSRLFASGQQQRKR